MRPMDALSFVKEAKVQYAPGGGYDRIWRLLGQATVNKATPRVGPSQAAQSWDNSLHDTRFSSTDHEIGQVVAKIGTMALNLGEIFIVRRNMCELIEGVWEAMPEQSLLASDLPSESGIVFFEKPIHLYPGGPGIWGVTFQSAVTRSFAKSLGLVDDKAKVTLERTRGCWVLPFHDNRDPAVVEMIQQGDIEAGNPEEPMSVTRRRIAAAPTMMFADFRMFTYGQPPCALLPSPFGGDMLQRDAIMGRLVAFFALCRQELPQVERFEPTSKELRQLRRMDMRTQGVSVIMLRRQSGHGNEDTEVEWSHRWLVRGHWRKQWYASDQTHRLIYINPHIKGPEDKPFKMTEKVNILGR